MAEYFGYDTLLKIYNGSTYTTIAQVRDIEGPGLKMDTIEVTSRDTSKWRKRIAGLKDGGTVTFDIVYDPDAVTHDSTTATTGLAYYMLNGLSRAFQLVLPDVSPQTIAFTAFVTSFKPKAPMEGALTADVELQITGAVTIA